jgi:putative membrane-bound dehydrogenase-like protein
MILRQALIIWLLLFCVDTPLVFGQGYSPEESTKRMHLPAGFRAKLVAAEPIVRQPVAIEFDDRGRLWVIQYLQYPNPAGLKRVKVDRYSRTVYDRIPEPPPRGPKGADRITILESIDSDGRAHRAKDFVSGLNLATGIAFGHGGVFVLQTPYLLFYPDRNRDDIPDGEPEVLLRGFGMEDAHSVANSLTWGPDGWLYGCQGSTVTANIRGVEFQQGVWRYHPISRRFELFCEGGGNSWGLDFDRSGNLLYSTNVGGFVMLHGVQGGYYWKSFGKHGALHNPFAYGYFDHVAHRHFRGGHVTVGGIIYQGDSFPPSFRDKYIAADLLGHAIYWHDVEPCGSTFTSSHGGELLLSNDTWFAPSDVTLGPDGSIFVADWYDKRTAHPDPDAEWDRTNGRIYKIEAADTRPVTNLDLAKLSNVQLVTLLSHPNQWYARKARCILADRRDPGIVPALRQLVLTRKDQLGLEALWALYVSGGFDEKLGVQLLRHGNADVRRWVVRLLGDQDDVLPSTAHHLAELAASERDSLVRSQLASSAKRLPAKYALPIIQSILIRNEDRGDAHIPLLVWWAVEQHAISSLDQVVDLFASPKAWEASFTRDVILGRLIRRYAAEGTQAASGACLRLLASAPSSSARNQQLEAFYQGLRERRGAMPTQPQAGPNSDTSYRTSRIPSGLEEWLISLQKREPANRVLIQILAYLGNQASFESASKLLIDRAAPLADRLAVLESLSETGNPALIPALLALFIGNEPEPIQLAALNALQRFNDSELATTLIRRYPKKPGSISAKIRTVLFSRRSWARAFLEALDHGEFNTADIPLEQLRPIALFRDPQLDALVHKHWGSLQSSTPEEKLAEIRRLKNDLNARGGDSASGRVVFQKQCANCHRLFGEGNQVGPDLTHLNRNDRDYLLISIVDPSATIRKEYLTYVVHTTDGRILTGLIAEQTGNSVTLVGAKNERTTISRQKIELMVESSVSLMPENLLKDLTPDQVRDLFSYLQTGRPN